MQPLVGGCDTIQWSDTPTSITVLRRWGRRLIYNIYLPDSMNRVYWSQIYTGHPCRIKLEYCRWYLTLNTYILLYILCIFLYHVCVCVCISADTHMSLTINRLPTKLESINLETSQEGTFIRMWVALPFLAVSSTPIKSSLSATSSYCKNVQSQQQQVTKQHQKRTRRLNDGCTADNIRPATDWMAALLNERLSWQQTHPHFQSIDNWVPAWWAHHDDITRDQTFIVSGWTSIQRKQKSSTWISGLKVLRWRLTCTLSNLLL